MSDQDIANGIAFLVVCVSIVSAFYSYKSKEISLKALAIAKEELSLKKDNLSIYLVDGFKFQSDGKGKILAFHLSITNKSVTGNSIERIEVQISFVRADGSMGSVVMPHDEKVTDSMKVPPLTPFSLPSAIAPKSSCSMWGLFIFPDEVLLKSRIDKYTLRITDVAGNFKTIDSYLVKEIFEMNT